ncbi:MAG: RNA polymerase factor sigma-54 [Proteobacteria bacterium]|nr:RNA polymerase factor sigma-54 [Pseudomonadota bacterium]
MALEQRINLGLKLSQTLRMTPQLRQAIKILQVSRADLEAMVDAELAENPALEQDEFEAEFTEGSEAEGAETETADAAEKAEVAEAVEVAVSEAEDAGKEEAPTSEIEENVDWDEYVERHSNDMHGAVGSGSDRDDSRPSIFETTGNPESDLRQALIDQLGLAMMSEGERRVGTIIILNINEDGYLDCSEEEIASMAECSLEQVTEVRDIIRQEFDPPGAASLDLRDCLMAQAKLIGYEEDDYVVMIIDAHLGELESRHYDQVARKLDCSVEEVIAAHDIISDLEPKPGRNYGEREARYISPDAYIYRVGNEFKITLNDEGLPALKVNPEYRQIVNDKSKDNKEKNSEARGYLQDKVRSAEWMIRSIEQRQRTLRKVTESIVKFQGEFLMHGVDKLKPMVLKDVASDIEMHESTISRTTSNKYVHTPQGLFELKYFFTSSLKSSGGSDVSSESVKKRIRTIIQAEDSAKPFSDQYIADKLKESDISIARRTVAKYREVLGILPSSKRKSYVATG